MAQVRAPQNRWVLGLGDALFRWRSYIPYLTVRLLAKRTRLLRSHPS